MEKPFSQQEELGLRGLVNSYEIITADQKKFIVSEPVLKQSDYFKTLIASATERGLGKEVKEKEQELSKSVVGRLIPKPQKQKQITVDVDSFLVGPLLELMKKQYDYTREKKSSEEIILLLKEALEKTPNIGEKVLEFFSLAHEWGLDSIEKALANIITENIDQEVFENLRKLPTDYQVTIFSNSLFTIHNIEFYVRSLEVITLPLSFKERDKFYIKCVRFLAKHAQEILQNKSLVNHLDMAIFHNKFLKKYIIDEYYWLLLETKKELKIPSSRIISVSPQLNYVAAISKDEPKILLFDINTGYQIKILEYDRHLTIDRLLFSPNEKYIIGLINFRGTIIVWDLQKGSISHTFKLDTVGNEHCEPIRAAISNNNYLVAAPYNEIKIWDIVSGDVIRQLLGSYAFSSLDISADGQNIYTLNPRNLIAWDIKKQQKLWNIPNDGNISVIKISPDQKYIIGEGRETMYAFDAEIGKRLWSSKIEQQIKSFDVGKNKIACLLMNDNVVLLDLQTGKKILELFFKRDIIKFFADPIKNIGIVIKTLLENNILQFLGTKPDLTFSQILQILSESLV